VFTIKAVFVKKYQLGAGNFVRAFLFENKHHTRKGQFDVNQSISVELILQQELNCSLEAFIQSMTGSGKAENCGIQESFHPHQRPWQKSSSITETSSFH
jgi:hypothetical protein